MLTLSTEWENKHRLLGQEVDQVCAELAAERGSGMKLLLLPNHEKNNAGIAVF
jgi:hypothetical protein